MGSVDYAFDAFGNRLWRKEYNGTPTLIGEERYGYDGWDTSKPAAIGTENFDVWVDLDNSNTLRARYAHGPEFDDLEVYRPTKAIQWYATDHLGSIRNLVVDGSINGTLAYDAFGKITSSSGPMGRYGYTGREHDSLTEDIYMRARVYDPDTGRFFSADPIGFAAGDANIYRYVGNFVTGATDPSGLNEVRVVGDSVKSKPTQQIISTGYEFSFGKVIAGDMVEHIITKKRVPLEKVMRHGNTVWHNYDPDDWKEWFDENAIDGPGPDKGNIPYQIAKGLLYAYGDALEGIADVVSNPLQVLEIDPAQLVAQEGVGIVTGGPRPVTAMIEGVYDEMNRERKEEGNGVLVGRLIGMVIEAIVTKRVGGGVLGKLGKVHPRAPRVNAPATAVVDNPAHNAALFERYKMSLFAEEIANPGNPMRGPVVVDRFAAPKPTTAAQEAQLREYAALASLAEREGYLSPTGRVSTGGAIEQEAIVARRLERLRAEAAGTPYGSNVAAHAPDSGWLGRGDPPFWLSAERRVNATLSGQQQRYPLGYRPTRFIFIGDLP